MPILAASAPGRAPGAVGAARLPLSWRSKLPQTDGLYSPLQVCPEASRPPKPSGYAPASAAWNHYRQRRRGSGFVCIAWTSRYHPRAPRHGLRSHRRASPRLPLGNTVLANVKNSLLAAHRAVAAKHLPRYLGAFAWRFNRRFVLKAIHVRLAIAAAATPPMPFRLLNIQLNVDGKRERYYPIYDSRQTGLLLTYQCRVLHLFQ